MKWTHCPLFPKMSDPFHTTQSWLDDSEFQLGDQVTNVPRLTMVGISSTSACTQIPVRPSRLPA